jgi:tRNA(Ile)-lysidine synthase
VARFLGDELALDLGGCTLLIAVSGGADSTALLHILRLLRPRLGMALHAATFDHGLRPDSGAEASAVLDLCRDLDLPCTAGFLPVAAHAASLGLGLEEAGRALRYAALEEERRRIGADWTVTGHQRDDLEEDVLLRLLRGAGWPGLGGMPAADSARRLLRPLLLTPARELRAFLQRNGLPWLEDESNADPRFLRNRIRLEILPLLTAESPRLGDHIAHLWRMARLDETHWDRVFGGMPATEERGSGVSLDRSLLRKLDKASRLRLYMRAIARLNREYAEPLPEEIFRSEDSGGETVVRKRFRRGQGRASALFALDRAWAEGRGGVILRFPGGIAAEVRRGSVRFFRPDARQGNSL